MSDYFVKLYASILDSSVWSERAETRIVWITLLAMADQHGVVESSVPGLARRANVSLDVCDLALQVLLAPDPHSKSPEHEGRRIEVIRRGWRVLNYEAYRELRTRSQDDAAARKRAQRERERGSEGFDVLMARQNGRCGCCDEPFREPTPRYALSDHDHKSGAMRSLVCPSCNIHIGQVENGRRSTKQEAVEAYLERSRVTDVPPVTPASTSTSPSPSVSLTQEQDQKPVRRESVVEEIAAFVDGSFGQFRPIVEGYLRSQRAPYAVIQTLRMHLEGELGHQKVTPLQLGLAVQQYAANQGSDRFNPRYFAGFVRDVPKQIEKGGNRDRNTNEQRAIDREAEAQQQREEEEGEAAELLGDFKASNPERYAELERIAEGQVPKKITIARVVMVQAALVQLVRREVA